MKSLWLHLVRGYLRIGLFFYYRRFYIINKNAVPKTGPLVLLSNHNNALMDALLIATSSGRFSYFLTRASVFKHPKIKRFLKSLNMLPVYRVRDGWSSIQQNNAIFEYCSELLHKEKAIALFPEGNHNIKRTVRPLSKGFTRIIFDTLDDYPNMKLKIIPIGLNYERANGFADSVSMIIGSPLEAKSFVSDNRNSDVLKLKETIAIAFKDLTTHIPAENYDVDLRRLEEKGANFLKPKVVNSCINSNYEDCAFQSYTKPKTLKIVFKILMIVSLIVPYLVWKRAVYPKINEVEFVATFRFTIAITLVPLWILLITILLVFKFGLVVMIYYLLLTLIFSLLAVKL